MVVEPSSRGKFSRVNLNGTVPGSGAAVGNGVVWGAVAGVSGDAMSASSGSARGFSTAAVFSFIPSALPGLPDGKEHPVKDRANTAIAAIIGKSFFKSYSPQRAAMQPKLKIEN